MGEHGQAVERHVHRQIDEDVDAVVPNLGGKLIVVQLPDIVPDLGQRSNEIGCLVRPLNAGVAMHLELPPVM